MKIVTTSHDGFLWTQPLNQDCHYDYEKGALPQTDELFASSIIQAIPSNCTDKDVGDIIEAYFRAARHVLG